MDLPEHLYCALAVPEHVLGKFVQETVLGLAKCWIVAENSSHYEW